MPDTRAPLVRNISIVGVGHIGGSLAHDLLATRACASLTLHDSNRRAREKLGSLFPDSRIVSSLDDATRTADLLILATPLSAYPELLKAIAPALDPRTVVSDVGSVKSSVCEQFSQLLPPKAVSVPAHPVAGTEHSGVEHARANLFRNRYAILTPTERSTPSSVRLVKTLWQRVGARVMLLPPDEHDKILALTSHLPHAIAYALVLAALDGPHRSGDLAKLSAGGFRDFTRIAASSPQMWHDIFFANPKELKRSLKQFRDALDKIERAITKGRGEELLGFLSRAQASRRSILAEGQAGLFLPDEPDSSNSSLPHSSLAHSSLAQSNLPPSKRRA